MFNKNEKMNMQNSFADFSQNRKFFDQKISIIYIYIGNTVEQWRQDQTYII